MQQLKQYIAPSTTIFAFDPKERVMQDFVMESSSTMSNPGSAPIREPLDWNML